MAVSKVKQSIPVGSIHWVLDERATADNVIRQEAHEFSFSVCNDMEWLNEHMTEIFSKNQFDVAEVFKTPGKLRGKTPRTVRKQNDLTRAVRSPSKAFLGVPANALAKPLTDVFASNIQLSKSLEPKSKFHQELSHAQVTEDKENLSACSPEKQNHLVEAGAQNTDSRHHEMVDDEVGWTQPTMDKAGLIESSNGSPRRISSARNASRNHNRQYTPRITRSDTFESFVSAREDPRSKTVSGEHLGTNGYESPNGEEHAAIDSQIEGGGSAKIVQPSAQYSVSAKAAAGLEDPLQGVEEKASFCQKELADNDQHSSQRFSSEETILGKKNSFAALPAREPFAAKRSTGARGSQSTAYEASGRANTGTKYGPTSTGPGVESEDSEDDGTPLAQPTKAKRGVLKIHSKTSTQQLHEKFSMLGKINPARVSKSIASINPVLQPSSQIEPHDLNFEAPSSRRMTGEEKEDDWISPVRDESSMLARGRSTRASEGTRSRSREQQTELQIFSSQHAHVNDTFPQGTAKSLLNSFNSIYPNPKKSENESTTPAGSPQSHWKIDGPLSASKAKFDSFLKSARGMFASSAAASAQAKLEVLSPSASRNKKVVEQAAVEDVVQNNPALLHDVFVPQATESAETLVSRLSPDRKEEISGPQASQDCVHEQVQETREAERLFSAIDKHDPNPVDPTDTATEERSTPPKNEASSESTREPLPSKQKAQSSSAHTKFGEVRRPAKITKTDLSNSKPAAMSIRVGSQKIGQHISHPFKFSQQETVPPPVNTARPYLSENKGSSNSLRSASSAQGPKAPSNAVSSRLKALEAADRRREKDEREAQRKAEHRRRLEEERRQAQAQRAAEQQRQKATEQQRANEAKAAAFAQKQSMQAQQQQQLSQHQQDRQRKPELPRKHEVPHQKSYQASGTFEHGGQSQSKPDYPFSRPNSRGTNLAPDVQRPAVPHVNPAKPPLKRQFQPNAEDVLHHHPNASQGRQNNPQNAAKRRRTSEESAAPGGSRPTMAPPVRLSRKDVPSKFSQGLMHPAQSSQPGNALLKTATNTVAHPQHPKTPHANDLAKYSKAPIPFAEAANQSQFQVQHHLAQRALSKTPATASKPSPQYPNGDNISLPEIATDSEDSDDENDFVPPEWANSPELRHLLQHQQLVDPMKVFGPIAPLAVEDVFKGGNKERQARLRARTSSANWNGPDRLTEEERRRDFEAREKLEKDGGWSFNLNV